MEGDGCLNNGLSEVSRLPFPSFDGFDGWVTVYGCRFPLKLYTNSYGATHTGNS